VLDVCAGGAGDALGTGAVAGGAFEAAVGGVCSASTSMAMIMLGF
jgi:hypothetical protein